MSYDIRDSSALEALREYGQGVIAALEARDALKPSAAPWHALDAKLRAARDTRDEARFARVRTIRRYGVVKADFFDALTKVSGHAYLLADKDASKPPYATLFKHRTAAEMRDLGFNNLKDQGDALFAAANDVTAPELADGLAKLRASFDLVVAAGEARKAARLALMTHENARAAFVIETEELGDVTEAAILGLFPGRSDLVRVILSPSLDASPADKKDNEEPKPTPPPEA